MKRQGSLVLACVLAAGTAVASPPPEFTAVEQLAQTYIEGGQLPSVALAIARRGEIVYLNAFGQSDQELDQQATVHTAYALASISKPVTATALMLLKQQRGLDLSAPVSDYVPGLQLRDAKGDEHPVSLMHLLSHTSGLGTFARIHHGKAQPGSESLQRDIARYAILVHPPGRVSEYSNLGYGLIGEVIEAQSGQTLADYARTTLFEPLGLHDAFFDTPRSATTSVAAPYDAAMQRLATLYNNTPGAGNAYMSVHDLLRFGMLHLDPESTRQTVLKPQDLQAMQANAVPQALHHYYGAAYYGLGWYVRPAADGPREIWHEGGMPGTSTIIKMLPEQGIVAVVLSNRSDANEITQALANALISAVMPEYQPVPLNPVANYSPYLDQPAFLGRWQGSITVEGKDVPCSLVLQSGGSGEFQLPDTLSSDGVRRSTLRAMVHGDSLISGFPGRLPSGDIAASDEPLLLLKLLRTGDRLSGTVVAYSSPQRLDYLLPFPVSLRLTTSDPAPALNPEP